MGQTWWGTFGGSEGGVRCENFSVRGSFITNLGPRWDVGQKHRDDDCLMRKLGLSASSIGAFRWTCFKSYLSK